MNRDRAVSLLRDMLERLTSEQEEWPLSLVNEVHVFGSFARGATEPHDVDLAVEFNPAEERFLHHSMTAMSQGFDGYAVIRHALVGRRRGAQFQFNQLIRMTTSGRDFAMTLLWRRGEPLQQALDRLRAIAADPTAKRADRDWMLPEFEGLDQWIPGTVRQVLHTAVLAGGLHIDRLNLEDGTVIDQDAADHLDMNWKPGGDAHRAATAVLAHFEQRGVHPAQVRVQRWGFGLGDKLYYAGFQWRYFNSIQSRLAERHGVEWLEVIRLTRSGPLPTLRLRPANREALAETRWRFD